MSIMLTSGQMSPIPKTYDETRMEQKDLSEYVVLPEKVNEAFLKINGGEA